MTRNVQKTLGLLRIALLASVALPLIIATSVRAQDATAPTAPTTGSNISGQAPAATEATAERVIVTGSNIPTAEEVGPNPVDTYRRDDITRLGVRTPTDLIQRIPAVTGSNIGENVTNGGAGVTQINLRGIDPKETLVLQDGRRLANFAFAGSFVDFNVFPLGLIDHIDILKDGASPIYGTEAVAGVVNVFLIHHFRGLEVYASYGNTNLGFANDQGTETAYLLAGAGDDKTNIVVYAGIYNAAAIYSRDVNIAHDANKKSFGGLDIRSGNLPGRVTSRFFLGLAAPPFKLNLKTPTPHSSANQFTDPEYAAAGSPGLTSERTAFNFSDLTPSVPATDREYLYGSFDRDLCDKYLTMYADFKYVRQFWNGGLAPAPFTPDIWTDSTHPFGISAAGISVPTQNAFNPFTTADYTSPGGFNPVFPNTQASAAPVGTEFTTGVRYRGIEAGLRTDKIYDDNYVFTGGLKGNLGEFANAWDQLKTWEWDFGVRYNEDYRIERFGGIVNNNALRTALLDTDPATAFNPFGTGKHSNPKFVLDRVYVTTNHVGWTSLLTEDLTLRGDAFNLPGGAVRFAVGGVHLTNHTIDNPDPLTASGQTTGATNFAPTRGSRDSWSVFEEVRVPVTGPTWNFPGAYSLELGYAEREEFYSDFGQTQRPKFDVRWQPIDQSLTLRAAYIEAFHAPALGELFSGTAQGFPGLTDPYNPTFASQYEQHTLGNPNLKPEIAYEYTYGGVLTPGKWWAPLQGLTLSADLVHIDIRGFTATLTPQTVLHLSETNPSFLFINGPGPLTQSWLQRDGSATAPILLINTPEANLGRFITTAWDFEAVEVFDTSRLGHGDWGTFTATTNWTYLVDADIQFLPGGPRQTVVGKYGGGFQGANGFGNFTHNRAYFSLFYDGPTGSWMQGIDTGAVVHYIGQYWDIGSDTVSDPVHGSALDRKVREWTTLDLILNYTFNLPPPAAQSEVAGYAKDGGKNVKMKDGKEKNVMPVSTAEYNPCGWRAWLNNTTLTLGVDNVFDKPPPFVAGFAESGDAQGYDESVANDKGRLWYVAIKKRW